MPVALSFMRTSFGPVVGCQIVDSEVDAICACLVQVLGRLAPRA
jgi:hypothetical protein